MRGDEGLDRNMDVDVDVDSIEPAGFAERLDMGCEGKRN